MAAAIVFVLALAVHRIGRRVVLRLVRGRPVWREVTRRIDLPTLALLPLLALQALGQALPSDLPGLSGLQQLDGVLLIGALAWTAIGAIEGGPGPRTDQLLAVELLQPREARQVGWQRLAEGL